MVRLEKVLLSDPIPTFLLSSLKAFFANEVISLPLNTLNGPTYKKVLSQHHKPNCSSKHTQIQQENNKLREYFELCSADVTLYIVCLVTVLRSFSVRA